MFLGVGFGITDELDVDPKVDAAHVALGVSASRIWPEAMGPYWFVGCALELSFGFAEDHPLRF